MYQLPLIEVLMLNILNEWLTIEDNFEGETLIAAGYFYYRFNLN